MRKIRVAATYAHLSEAVANAIAANATAAIQVRGVFSLVLSGGQTPMGAYELLSRLAVDWSRTHLFWTDERCVEPESEQSNFHMVREALLAKISIPADHVHRIKAELKDRQLAAHLYEDEVRSFFAHDASDGAPIFDLILLGVGTEGHTASLFPNTRPLVPRGRWIQAVWVEKLKTLRITMTAEIINSAREIFVLASGPTKAEIVSRVLEVTSSIKYPIQQIQPSTGQLTWFLDHDSSAQLHSIGVENDLT